MSLRVQFCSPHMLRRELRACVALLTVALGCGVSSAANIVTWTGTAGDNNWATPGNWSPEGVPGPTDDVTIPSGTTPVVISFANVTVNSLTNERRVEVGSGRTLTVTTSALKNELRLASTATLSGGVYTLTGNGVITFPATCSFARLNGVTINGNLPGFRGGMKWNNVTLNGTITAVGDGASSEIAFEGSQTITGTIEGSTNGELRLTPTAAGVLTIAADATVRGGNIKILSQSTCPNANPFSFSVVNNGTIDANVAGYLLSSSVALTNNGTIKCGPGNLSFTDFNGSTGTLSLSGGTLTMNGTFDPTKLGTFTRTGGAAIVAGTADMATQTWAIKGEWNVTGTVQNGTVDLAAGSLTFPAVCSFGRLSNVTLTGDLPTFSGGMKWNNVTLNGTITAAGSATAEIAFEGSQTLTGTIVSSTTGELRLVPFTAGDLTIAAGATLRGGNIKILTLPPCPGSTALAFTVINNGTIEASVAGQAITSTAAITNNGTIKGGPGNLTFAGFTGTTGTFTLDSGTLTFTDTFNPATLGTFTRKDGTGGTAIITGTADMATQTWAIKGDWTLKGTAQNGTIDLAAGKLLFPGSCTFGRLSEVTLNGDLPAFTGGMKWNNVTLNGTITATGTAASEIAFEGSQTITGTIAGNTTGGLRLTPTAAGVLTIATGATVRGGDVTFLTRSTCLATGPFAFTVVNNGTIDANVVSRSMTISAPLTNNGTMRPGPNSVLSISGATVTMGETSKLVIDIKNLPTSVSNYGRMTLTNNAASKVVLGGTVKFNAINGYVPECGAAWNFISSLLVASGTPITGTFATVDFATAGTGKGQRIVYKPKLVTVEIRTGADFNDDGFITFEDFDAFIAEFDAGTTAGDFNKDGFITFEDFDAFIAEFDAPSC